MADIQKVGLKILGLRKRYVAAGGFAIGSAVSLPAGYFLAKKRLRNFYEEKFGALAEKEIGEIKEYYAGKFRSLEEAEKKKPLEEIIKEQGYDKVEEAPKEVRGFSVLVPPTGDEQPTPYHKAGENESKSEDGVPDYVGVTQSEVPVEDKKLWDNVTSTGFVWDYARETKSRRPDVPYTIHIDEFNESEYSQESLTYYEVDDVLADEHDAPIDDMDATIGLGNLSRFGHGSDDPNVVYVRNEEIRMDYEITKNGGSYKEDVLGFLEHSDEGFERMPRRRRKFDDD